jgi:formamidopyrimidine-DNA glycosylase
VPELPEVETTRRALEPALSGRRVERVIVRERRLRWPIPEALERGLAGSTVTAVERRAKYLLLRTERGTALLHLGMSGSLRIGPNEPPGPHDHLDLVLEAGPLIRFRDPRRFGSALWCEGDPAEHPLLRHLGPEPLEPGFSGSLLHERSRGRRAAVKSFVMDGRVVVGVGNIYASEALHLAGIHPARPAGRIARARYDRLSAAIRQVLGEALEAGGTTLRDFSVGDGTPGYFSRRLRVYGRAGEPCELCGSPLRQRVIGQRASYFCASCQR